MPLLTWNHWIRMERELTLNSSHWQKIRPIHQGHMFQSFIRDILLGIWIWEEFNSGTHGRRHRRDRAPWCGRPLRNVYRWWRTRGSSLPGPAPPSHSHVVLIVAHKEAPHCRATPVGARKLSCPIQPTKHNKFNINIHEMMFQVFLAPNMIKMIQYSTNFMFVIRSSHERSHRRPQKLVWEQFSKSRDLIL